MTTPDITTFQAASPYVFETLQVGKTYLFFGRKGEVVAKKHAPGETNAAGWASSYLSVTVRWK